MFDFDWQVAVLGVILAIVGMVTVGGFLPTWPAIFVGAGLGEAAVIWGSAC